MDRVEKFFAAYPLKKYKRKSLLVSPGQKITDIFYLSEGNVRQYVFSREGEEFVIHIFKPGSFFPIALVLGDVKNRYYFEAETDIKAAKAPVEEVVSFLKESPQVLLDLNRRLSRGLHGVATRLEEYLGKPAQERLTSLLSYLAKSFGEPDKNGRQIKFSLTHQDLANWLGLSRETVSREMKRLQKKGLVSYKNQKIRVLESA